MPYDEEDLADGGVGEPRARTDGRGGRDPRRGAPAAGGRDPSAPAIDRPAHPRPRARNGAMDYDRFLEPPSARFQIFSAERRRQRSRTVVAGVAVVALVVLIVIWVVLSRSAA